jgi:predicted Fe-Mo cluster-binding NifX family protein
MKIAVASDDGVNISSHFGQTRGFVVYNIDDKGNVRKSYIENTFTGHAVGQHNHASHSKKHEAILKALSGCDVIISNGMGRMIYADLKNADIRPIITRETKVSIAIDLFIEKKLVDHPELGCVHRAH